MTALRVAVAMSLWLSSPLLDDDRRLWYECAGDAEYLLDAARRGEF